MAVWLTEIDWGTTVVAKFATKTLAELVRMNAEAGLPLTFAKPFLLEVGVGILTLWLIRWVARWPGSAPKDA